MPLQQAMNCHRCALLVACPISTPAGHKREVRPATKHRCAPAFSLRPLLAIARRNGKTRRPRAKPAHLLNDRCRSHSRRNRRPLQPMGQMNRHDLLPSSQTARIFSPEARNRSSCTPPPPCWSSPTFQSPDCRPDNGIRRSACPFPLLFHHQLSTTHRYTSPS